MKELTSVMMTFLFLQVSAIANDGSGRKRPPRVPPEQAISICSGKSSGASCTINNRRGEQVTGTCENTPDGKYFACKPPRPPKRERNSSSNSMMGQ